MYFTLAPLLSAHSTTFLHSSAVFPLFLGLALITVKFIILHMKSILKICLHQLTDISRFKMRF